MTLDFILGAIISIVLGAVLGSFATALAWRAPRDLPWTLQRSACPQCQAMLQPRDLVPVFSWMSSRGACRYCGAKIPVLYPLTELGTALAALGVYLVYGFSPGGLFIMALLPFLAALLVIDLRHKILPNRLVLIAGLLGFFRLITEAFFTHSLDPVLVGMNYVLGAFLYAGLALFLRYVMSTILKKDVLGLGDVKFFAVCGLWLGLAQLAWFCILAGVLGIVCGVVWQAIVKERTFPFGPALIGALYGLLLVQGSLLG
jgi:prepilin signal peptidase PulO-like enzyme (type II secretory pathway)